MKNSDKTFLEQKKTGKTSVSARPSPLGTFCAEERKSMLNMNLFNFTCLLVDFGKVLCSSANELQQNSNASSREDYILQTLTVC